MKIRYNKRGQPIITLNKNVTEFVVYECLECGSKMYAENGIDGLRCKKCGGFIDPIGAATREGFGEV